MAPPDTDPPPAVSPPPIGPGDYGGRMVRFGKGYELFCDRPLEALDAGSRRMFAARDAGGTPMVCLVSPWRSGPRTDVLPLLMGLEVAGHLRPLAVGVVDWPPAGGERFVTICEPPVGPLLMRSMADSIPRMREEEVINRVFLPLIDALFGFAGRGAFHGAIRPTNIYLPGSGQGTAQLGECFTTLVSLDQPALFETIERGMAEPVGRGEGGVTEDLYALGVTMLILLLGHDPMAGMSEAEMLDRKIDKGTYPALLGNLRLSGQLVEPLRAMLSDDPKQRWSLDEISLWIGGRRLSPKQPAVQRRAMRPFRFAERDLWRPRSLARAFDGNAGEAIKAISSGDLDRWLRRSAGDNPAANRVADAIASVGTSSKSVAFEDRTVARVGIALDPQGPIRYKGRRLLPAGLGAAIGHDLATGKDAAAPAEMLASQMPMLWFNLQGDNAGDYLSLIKELDLARSILVQNRLGYGIERVAYELCPTLPCLSPMLAGHIVFKPGDLIRALEVVAGRPDRGEWPIDRHMAAFLAARDGSIKDASLSAMGMDKPADKTLGMLHALAGIQRRAGITSSPNLTRWFGGLLPQLVERFRSKERRRRVERMVKDAVSSGNLAALYRVVNDSTEMQQDQAEFSQAQARFHALNQEAQILISRIHHRQWLERTSGRETAATLAGVLSLAAMTLIVIGRLNLI